MKFELFRDFWPQVTFYDLVTPFISKLNSRASLWYTIYPLSITFEVSPIFGIFDLGWPLLTSFHLFFEKLTSRASVWYIFYHILSKFEIWPFLGIFDLGWPFLTLGDLFWPWVTFFQKADAETVILIYSLSYFIKVRNLTFFGDFWPRVTFFDLGWPFFRKLTPRPSFWYIVYLFSMRFEIWP